MIIQCENCDTKYNIKVSSLGDSGRFVRCSKCGHEWVAYCDAQSALAEELAAQSIANNKKATKLATHKLHKTKSASFYFALTAFCIGIGLNLHMVSLALIYHMEPQELSNNPIYRIFKNHNNHDLRISEVAIKLLALKDHQQELDLNLVVKNIGKFDRSLSNLRVTAFNNKRERIADLVTENYHMIKPKEQNMFNNRIKDFPSAARYVSIEFADSYELAVRSAADLMHHKKGWSR
jgi:predicted Zn finger-like uncharacterized protein